jgi:hypothetical protein
LVQTVFLGIRVGAMVFNSRISSTSTKPVNKTVVYTHKPLVLSEAVLVPVFELPPQNERRSNKRDSVQTVILGIDVGAMVSTPAFRAGASKTRAGLESRLLEKSIIQ